MKADLAPYQRLTSAPMVEDTAALLEGLAALHNTAHEDGLGLRVSDFLDEWLPSQSISTFEFARDLQPRHIHSTRPGAEREIKEYLRGLYALDPIYLRFAEEEDYGIFALDLKDPQADVPDSYRRYWRNIAAPVELGILTPLADGRCLHISLFPKGKADIPAATAFISMILGHLRAMFLVHLADTPQGTETTQATRRQMHQAISEHISGFGREALTAREREIAELLLKGHSTKSIARLLDISPGTAAIHRSRVYGKLGVDGQGGLFAMFLNGLMRV